MEIKTEDFDLSDLDLNDIKKELEGEILGEDTSDLKEEKMKVLLGEGKSFNFNYSQFITQYKPTDILPSPQKKIKLENVDLEDSEMELEDDELESYLEGVKLPSPKKEEVEKVFKCGVCLELVLKDQEQARRHVESCQERKETEGDKQCGSCGAQTSSPTAMVQHWVTTCRKFFHREYSLHTADL